jgi:hypothetical protein
MELLKRKKSEYIVPDPQPTITQLPILFRRQTKSYLDSLISDNRTSHLHKPFVPEKPEMLPSLQVLLLLGAIAATLGHPLTPAEKATQLRNRISDANIMMQRGENIHTNQFMATLQTLMADAFNLAAEVGQNDPGFNPPVKTDPLAKDPGFEVWLGVLETFPRKLQNVSNNSSTVEAVESTIIACTNLATLVKLVLGFEELQFALDPRRGEGDFDSDEEMPNDWDEETPSGWD